jgi:5-methylcytosine-specific restriction endonuclease McrA
MQNSKTFGTCVTCYRHTALTKHHLIPKKRHKKSKKMHHGLNYDTVITVCRKCHDGIHDLYDERTLAEHFNTLEKLCADEALQKHFSWVAKCKKDVI